MWKDVALPFRQVRIQLLDLPGLIVGLILNLVLVCARMEVLCEFRLFEDLVRKAGAFQRPCFWQIPYQAILSDSFWGGSRELIWEFFRSTLRICNPQGDISYH